MISDGINLYYKADMAGDEPYWFAVNINMCAVLTCADRYKAAKYDITPEAPNFSQTVPTSYNFGINITF